MSIIPYARLYCIAIYQNKILNNTQHYTALTVLKRTFASLSSTTLNTGTLNSNLITKVSELFLERLPGYDAHELCPVLPDYDIVFNPHTAEAAQLVQTLSHDEPGQEKLYGSKGGTEEMG